MKIIVHLDPTPPCTNKKDSKHDCAIGNCIDVHIFYLGACVHQRTAPFIESEYASYEGDGSSTICGQVLLKTEAGIVVPGRLSEIQLTPKTTYSTEWFNKGIVDEQLLSDADFRTVKYNRKAKADLDGKFCFNNIPAGSYYLTSVIKWETGGAEVYGSTEVKDGQAVDVKVTRYLQDET